MKKTFAALLLFMASVAWISAQDLYTESFLNKLGIKADQITRILNIQSTSRNQIKEAALEMNIFKAQLEKMLYDKNPDMVKVKKLLEESLKYKLQSEIAAIEARVQIRKIMGENAWEKMLRARKRINKENRIQTRNAPQPPVTRNNSNGKVGNTHGK